MLSIVKEMLRQAQTGAFCATESTDYMLILLLVLICRQKCSVESRTVISLAQIEIIAPFRIITDLYLTEQYCQYDHLVFTADLVCTLQIVLREDAF